MKKWLKLFVLALEASIVLGVVYFEPTYGVRGIVWREAFFDGKSTSYWRNELDRWEVTRVHIRAHPLEWCGSQRGSVVVYTRNSTWFERQRERWFPAPVPDDNWLHFMPSEKAFQGPSIVRGNADAAPVLRELLDDPSPRVRLIAEIGLGLNPEFGTGDDWSGSTTTAVSP